MGDEIESSVDAEIDAIKTSATAIGALDRAVQMRVLAYLLDRAGEAALSENCYALARARRLQAANKPSKIP